MKTFGRSKWVIFKSVFIYSPGAAFVVMGVVGVFTHDPIFIYGLPAVSFAAMLYYALVSSNIYFELLPDGRLRYYKSGKLKQTFDATKCSIGYYREKTCYFAADSLSLTILTEGDDDETSIECDALGSGAFMEMYKALRNFSPVKPEVLSAD